MILAAAVQLNCSSDSEANWRGAETLIRRAAGYGAGLVATPENTNYLGPHRDKVARAEPLEGPTCARFAALAAELHIYLLLGSYNERSEEAGRCYNTSVLFGPGGERLAVYRKIHLFDVDLPHVRFLESETCAPGTEVVTASTPFGKLGLSICYDLRFGELYRELTLRGAEILMVPSAFTLATGRDHWLPLLQARAIENQCYVIAPAQHGAHDDHGLRESYGHAAILDPWGIPLAVCADGPGLALAEVELERVRNLRLAMPVGAHRRLTR